MDVIGDGGSRSSSKSRWICIRCVSCAVCCVLRAEAINVAVVLRCGRGTFRSRSTGGPPACDGERHLTCP